MDDATEREADGSAWLSQGSPAPTAAFDPAGGSIESITAVIDALAAERGQPRVEIIRRTIADIEGRIAVDRAVIALLRRLERS